MGVFVLLCLYLHFGHLIICRKKQNTPRPRSSILAVPGAEKPNSGRYQFYNAWMHDNYYA